MDELQTMIEKYRHAAINCSLKERAELLRKILKEENTIGWRDALADVENTIFRELDLAARKAVNEKNMPLLQKIVDELKETPWSIQINQTMISKIDSILKNHYRTVEEEKAQKLINAVNDAYSALDYADLAMSLKEYDLFIEECSYYTPEESTLKQISEAREYFEIRKKERLTEITYERLLEELRVGLLNGKPLVQLEKCVNTIKSMDKEIPRNIWAQFISFKEDTEIIQKRQKFVKTIGIFLAVIVLLGGIGIGAFVFLMKQREDAWVEKISASLANEPAEVALSLLNDLEKESPMLRKRASIMALQHQAEEKKKEDDIKQQNFNTLAAQMEEKFTQFDQNVKILGEIKEQLKSLVVNDADKARYQMLCDEYDNRKMAYDSRQDMIFRSKFNMLEKKLIVFHNYVENAEIDSAGKAFEEISKLLQELRDIPGASPALRDQLNDLVSLTDLKNKFDNAARSYSEFKNAYNNFMHSSTFAEFDTNARKLAIYLPEKNLELKNKVAKFSRSDLNAAQNISSGTPQNIPLFKEDYTQFITIMNARENLRKRLIEKLEKRFAEADSTDEKMMIITNDFGDICTLLFKNSKIKAVSAKKRLVELTCLANEEDDLYDLRVDYDIETLECTVSRIGSSSHMFKGKIVYPGNKEMLFSTPSIVYVLAGVLAENLKENPDDPEKIAIQTIQTVLKEPAILPMLAIAIIDPIYTELANMNKDHYQLLEVRIVEAFKNYDLAKFKIITSGNELSDIRSKLKTVTENMPYPYKEQEFTALGVALSRKLSPAGFICQENGKLKWIRFKDAPVSGEAWLINDTGSFSVIGSYQNNELKAKISAPEFVKIIFTPCDGRSTSTLQHELLFDNSDVILPGSWPQL